MRVTVGSTRRVGGVALRLWVLCWVVYAVHWAPFLIREHLPAITLAEDGTLDVSRFRQWSEDVFETPSGRVVINNNPGASILAAVPLFLARPALEAAVAWNRRQPRPTVQPTLDSPLYRAAVAQRTEWYYLLICFVTAAGLMAPLSAATVVVMYRVLRGAGADSRSSALLALAYGFGTPIFLRTGYLNHNLLVGHAGFVGLWLLWNGGERHLSGGRAMLAGALGGLALLADYSGLLVIGGLGLYTWLRSGDDQARRTRLRTLLAFAVGMLPGVLALAAYQLENFGSPLLPSQQFMPPIAQTAQGYRGFDWPSPALAWKNFFDVRFGLFVYCPLLLLSLVAPWLPRSRTLIGRRERLVLWTFVGAFVLFCAANRYSALQWNTGVRYLVPVIPPLFLLTVSMLATLPRRVAAVLLGVSVLENWLVALTHANLPMLLDYRSWNDLQYSWLRRMFELGLIDHPSPWSWALAATCALGVAAAWWRLFPGERRGSHA